MSFNLRNRSLLTVQDYTQREFQYVLDLARDLKRAKYARTEQKHLEGRETAARGFPALRYFSGRLRLGARPPEWASPLIPSKHDQGHYFSSPRGLAGAF